MSAQARTVRTPEYIRGRIDSIAKSAMGDYLSKVFRNYELHGDLPGKDDVKSEYYAFLSGKLYDIFGAELGGNGPLPPDQVSGLRMASKFNETVGSYAESVLSIKHRDAERRIRERAAMTDEQKLQAAQKENIKNAAPPKERRRGRINKKANKY